MRKSNTESIVIKAFHSILWKFELWNTFHSILKVKPIDLYAPKQYGVIITDFESLEISQGASIGFSNEQWCTQNKKKFNKE